MASSSKEFRPRISWMLEEEEVEEKEEEKEVEEEEEKEGENHQKDLSMIMQSFGCPRKSGIGKIIGENGNVKAGS